MLAEALSGLAAHLSPSELQGVLEAARAIGDEIVRTRHRQAVPTLPALFAGYGTQSLRMERQATMLVQYRHLLAVAQHQAHAAGVSLWQARLQATVPFVELAR